MNPAASKSCATSRSTRRCSCIRGVARLARLRSSGRCPTRSAGSQVAFGTTAPDALGDVSPPGLCLGQSLCDHCSDSVALVARHDALSRRRTPPSTCPRRMPRAWFFPWGTPVDGRGCRTASQVLKAVTREPEIRLEVATDIAVSLASTAIGASCPSIVPSAVGLGAMSSTIASRRGITNKFVLVHAIARRSPQWRKTVWVDSPWDLGGTRRRCWCFETIWDRPGSCDRGCGTRR